MMSSGSDPVEIDFTPLVGQGGGVDSSQESCAHCGRIEHRLRYGNLQTGAKYCTEECLKHDPAWSDDDPWLA